MKKIAMWSNARLAPEGWEVCCYESTSKSKSSSKLSGITEAWRRVSDKQLLKAVSYPDWKDRAAGCRDDRS
jgi:hypothetical protein